MISKSNLSGNNDSTQNQSFSQPTSKDLMTEERLQFQSPDAKRSPPPSRNASPENTFRTDSLLGASNVTELYIKAVEEIGRLKQEVKMLKESN